ncbi:MAG: hypothetical protein J6D44_17000, partial [Pseudomonas sp.]|nr:hypothetical protein [Pseudomonas sp.]
GSRFFYLRLLRANCFNALRPPVLPLIMQSACTEKTNHLQAIERYGITCNTGLAHPLQLPE